MNKQITTISFFKFSSLFSKIWAFVMMLLAHNKLYKVKGLLFYRLMGSGKGKGFNPLPDWSVYSLIQVWESEEVANNFFNSSNLIKKYKSHTVEIYTLYMKNISAVGTWINKTPFKKETDLGVVTLHGEKISNSFVRNAICHV